MALMSHSHSNSMDGSAGGSSRPARNNIPLGLNKHSTKITKPLKRTPAAATQHQQHPQPGKQTPPPPVYNINKNDFRNVVQRLTGSPLTERYDQQQPPPPPPPVAAAAPPPNPRPPNSRLQRIRPPPLNALNSSSATGPPSLLRPPPSFGNAVSPFFSVSPLPPLTPGDAIWAGNMAVESPVTRYMKYLQDSMTPGGGGLHSRNPSPRGYAPPPPGGFYSQRPMQYMVGPPLPSPHRPPPPLPSPTSQFLLPSPLPSPGSFFALPSPGSPFPPNFFAHSPSGQFGFPGGGPLLSPLPPSPGVMFSLHSPTGRFPSQSPRWREPSHSDLPREDFSFPDPDRRL